MNHTPAIQTPIPGGAFCIHTYDEREIEAVTRLLRDPGKMFRNLGINGECECFEQEVCQLTGAGHALMVSSGSSALSCCLAALRIGPGDDVIISAYTYIATAAAVLDVGAIPILAEIDDTLGMDPIDLERKITPYTKAIIVTHMQGVPAAMDALRAVAKKHGLYVIEDCCQAIGSRYHGVYCGVESDAFAWSLNYFKTITCGEGGVFFCREYDDFARGVCQSDPASTMWADSTLFKEKVQPFARGGYRANELTAAIARVQLTKLEGIVARTRALKKALIAALDAPIHYQLQRVDDPEGDAGISFAIICRDETSAAAMSEALAVEGLKIGSIHNGAFPDRHIYAYWDAIMEQSGPTAACYPFRDPAYKGRVAYSRDMCPRTLDILHRCLRFGLNPAMSEQNVAEIALAINRADKSF